MGLRDQEEESPAHGSESSMAGIHVPSSVLSSLKALWHVVGAVSTHQIRVDFWERLVVSGGRVARCWMQEAAFKVWSLEQGNLMPEPRPTLTSPPHLCTPCISAGAEPHPQPISPSLPPWQLCPSGNSDTWSARGSARIFHLSVTGFLCMGLKSLSSGSFLRRKPAAELSSMSPPSSHRARICPSRSAACDAGPQKDQCM